MIKILRFIFFVGFVKPLVLIVLGLNIRGKNNLPLQGPAVLAANHNSHLDTLVLMSLYPIKDMHKIRPVAAADYFLSNTYLAWFALNIIGIIPLDRKNIKSKTDLFKGCHEALDNGDILIIFPEGSRGEPEQISTIKKGLFHLANDRQDLLIFPILMHGLGKALPKSEALFVPFNCDVIIGKPLENSETPDDSVKNIEQSFEALSEYCITLNDWV